jgi:flagellar basal body-associated protein FliL
MSFDFMDNMSSFITAIVAIPFVIVALVLLFIVYRGWRKARISQSWPTTSGRVLGAGVEPRRSHSSEGGYSTSYYPVVLYEYSVMGRTFQSNRLTVGGEVGYGFPAWAQRVVAGYTPGAMVTVYYNPENPAEAVLQTTSGSRNKILLLVVVIMVVILAATIFFTTSFMGSLFQ